MTAQDDIDRLLHEAGLTSDGAATSVEQVVAEVSAQLPAAQPAPPRFEALARATQDSPPRDISLLENVTVRVQVLLGRTRLTVEEILKLTRDSVVELDRLAGEPLDILVNDKLVAQGEVLVLNENFCIRVTDIIPPDERG